MVLKDWKKITNQPKYKVWNKIDKRIGWYNPFSLVAKTEMGNWVVFLDTGTFGGGTEVLVKYFGDTPKIERKAVRFAKAYMMKR